ncbi:uncharacterized protein RAG0_03386 [Rhynchosporium agropyri]|uniref:Uncharacterized protein n=1 Tax=Rhynchosporium agropyri TaxID=914238 RepID=A0A1E1K443_9HELO|nr:uncharacterized protein RAG0_03386 [Rhynchosporium agropyri]
MNKSYVYNYPGHVIGNSHQRREWYPWNLTQPYERKRAFAELQTMKKKVDRGHVKQQVKDKIQSRPQDVIDLDEINPQPKVNSNRGKKTVAQIKSEIVEFQKHVSNKRRRALSPNESIASTTIMQDWPPRPRRKIVKIKEEPIEVDPSKNNVSHTLSALNYKHDSPDPGIRNKQVKSEDEPEVVDTSASEDAEPAEPQQDFLSGADAAERWEIESRNDELEKEIEGENRRAKQDLAEILSMAETDVAEISQDVVLRVLLFTPRNIRCDFDF